MTISAIYAVGTNEFGDMTTGIIKLYPHIIETIDRREYNETVVGLFSAPVQDPSDLSSMIQFSLSHPITTHVDKDSWVDFLRFSITTSKSNGSDWEIINLPKMGPDYFRFRYIDDNNQESNLCILVEREPSASDSFETGTVLEVFDHDLGDQVDHFKYLMDEESLSVIALGTDGIIASYKTYFKHAGKAEDYFQFYLGLEYDRLRLIPTDEEKTDASPSVYELATRRIGRYHWYESLDGKIKLKSVDADNGILIIETHGRLNRDQGDAFMKEALQILSDRLPFKNLLNLAKSYLSQGIPQ